jgi:hypothetical protein
LPRFLIDIVVLILFVLVAVLIIEVIIFVVVLVVFVKGVMKHKGAVRDVAFCHDVGSAAGFAFSRPGVGYVDQKWRPHLGQTQN